MTDLVERARHEIDGWERAYPLSAFPEPDLKRAAAVLKEDGMTLDAISASNMRHVVKCLAPITHELIDRIEADAAMLEKVENDLRAAVSECTKYAREAGEAKGKLDASEMAGIVEGWKERCERAETSLEKAREAMERIAKVDHGGGFLGAQACRKLAAQALKELSQ